jgi:glucose 1-dehydrogenase
MRGTVEIMDTQPLLGRVAAVTGSSSGIGRAIALELAAAGADVAVSYHSDEASANEVVEKIRGLGRRAFPSKLNASEETSVGVWIDATEKELGPVDILVNCAGIDGKTGNVWEIAAEDWDQVIGVNLRGPFLCIRKVLPGMIARGKGAILNITSVHEVIPWGGHSAYCAAKAAMGMMTRSLALELQDSGVRVLALAPGAIRTPINKNVWDDPKAMADLKTKIPLGRIGEPEEIARVARMLVSDDASYMTGVTVTVDGAMTAYPSFAHGG